MSAAAMIERAALDAQFQAACQQYAHGNGSSHAIAAAALRAVAAPELLEALEALLGMDVAYQRGPRVEAAVAVGCAAIAKAKGEQQ
ncbi:hypothetical protein AVE30378_02524 [Achromobacter veterisilvae]|uniref:Uncharacterized protein n=1 Tax=Achromobacter veterisilvae TaxID=2069367 RepID=A0A446CH61_9BURK|nr:hypothetical protein [Achromobacter veterisilvae]SSW67246.1 hypothetical protein AVE30378_02524 [Achromobacter veterisilvae]